MSRRDSSPGRPTGGRNVRARVAPAQPDHLDARSGPQTRSQTASQRQEGGESSEIRTERARVEGIGDVASSGQAQSRSNAQTVDRSAGRPLGRLADRTKQPSVLQDILNMQIGIASAYNPARVNEGAPSM